MRMALVTSDGEVVNVIEAEPDFVPESSQTLVTATSDVAIGWRWDGANFASPLIVPETPVSVTDLQFRLALNAAGLRKQAEELVQSGPQDWRDYWDRSLEIHRRHPLIEQARIALGKTDEDIDELFRLAANF